MTITTIVIVLTCALVAALAACGFLVWKLKNRGGGKSTVAAMVAALAIGAGGGKMTSDGPKFTLDNGLNTKTVFVADNDTTRTDQLLRPERNIIINYIDVGQTFTVGGWVDTTLKVAYTYKKVVPSENGKKTRVIMSFIVDDSLEVK